MQILGLAEITVATAGTPVQVSATSLVAAAVTIQADPANTGKILVKDGSSHHYTIASLAAGAFWPPTPFEATKFAQDRGVDLSTLYLDTDTNGSKAFVGYSQ